MPHLFSADAVREMDDIATRSPLLALDFDGTLAPIVAQPNDARAGAAVSRVLMRIADFIPVAIITGRSVTDVSGRLGFTPDYIVGNHGAEGLPGSEDAAGLSTVARWSDALCEKHGLVLEAAGVLVENKGHSISLHYRLARNREAALEAIYAAIESLVPPPRLMDGKCIVNLLLPDAPDKFHAVLAVSRLVGSDAVIFAGDDVTDDMVFEQAPPEWLTIRIEAREHHRARFYLNHQNEVAIFLQRLLACIERSHEANGVPRRRDKEGTV